MTPVAPVFVVGMPRSGTTVLSQRLRRAGVAMSRETHWLSRWVRRGRTTSDHVAAWRADETFEWLGPVGTRLAAEHTSTWSDRDVLAAVVAWTAEREGVARGGEKTPDHWRHVDTLLEWFPDARIVFLVRDPRAVCYSIARAPWGSDDMYRSARKWWRAAAAADALATEPRVRVVRYEDLTDDPVPSVAALLDFVGVPSRDVDVEELVGEVEAAGSTSGDWDARNRRLHARPVAPSPERWRSLAPRTIAMIEGVTRPFFDAHGYEPASRRVADRAVRLLSAQRGAGRLLRGSATAMPVLDIDR